MVYRLSKMKLKTKILFFCTIWIISVIFATLGSAFITTAAILPNTPYEIRENSIIMDIRSDLGQWQSWNYYDIETGVFYPDITLKIENGHLEVYTFLNQKLPYFKPFLLEEVRENGIVTFFTEVNILAFLFSNGTAYEVHVGFQETIWVDVQGHELIPQYQPGKSFPIFAFQSSSGERDEPVGYYFIVTNRTILD